MCNSIPIPNDPARRVIRETFLMHAGSVVRLKIIESNESNGLSVVQKLAEDRPGLVLPRSLLLKNLC